MPISSATGTPLLDAETPLLDDVVNGSVDFKGRPVTRPGSGGWKSASFIIGVEVAERFAYYGISSNLISYLTGPLGQSTATAAENVNAWSGTASLLPLLGAFVADSLLGRYWTIIVASGLYILGLGFLSLSAALYSFKSSDCQTACSPPEFQIIIFFLSLYLVALAQGGHKPCVQAFGADQFDEKDPKECESKSSFFNWWYFSMCAGVVVALFVLNYIQDNLNWGLGFGIPCIIMCLALIIFLLGTTTYRFSIQCGERSPFVRIGRVFLNAARNWRTTPAAISKEEEAQHILPYEGSQQFKLLNKALLAPDGSKDVGKVCSINEIEEAKAVLRLIPIWITCLGYAIVFSQSSTLFTKQGVTMDRSITSSFQIPAASLQSFISLAIVVFIPIYDRILVPIARTITRKPSGITMLQRIGTGILLSFLSMIIAALVEMKRLKIAVEYGLVDMPKATVPMSVWWLLPQYLLFGVSDVFTMVGLQEFFYDQVPRELKSIGLALYLSIFGIGSFLSSFLISVVEKATSGPDRDSWFSDNLNRAHIDYFYWLLAGISAVAFVAYLYFAKSYIYNRKNALFSSLCSVPWAPLFAVWKYVSAYAASGVGVGGRWRKFTVEIEELKWDCCTGGVGLLTSRDMAISSATGTPVLDAETPLLDDVVHGSVDFKGRPVTHPGSGGWKSASFIIGVEVAERFAYYGISSNLISYLTGPLGQSTATAAENVNAWSGTASLLPLLGAFVADSLLGRYWTIILASGLYILGLGFLSLSAALYSFKSSDCQTACSPPKFQIIIFFLSLYLVALAQGGHKPCVQAFGADQFDEKDPKECKSKSSFFNWWYFSMCAGVVVALFALNYIQDNLNWGLGFGIPCIIMCLALIIFLLGTTTYRFSIQCDERSPFVRIGRVFLNAARNWRTTPAAISKEEEAQHILPYEGSQQFK
ncbi:unnamed protein product [Fraxinus pennsylvanica]|uniref:Protein NRT1/ PTR FAMILY 5.10-like n=1 Tax=Fraxinus pennsylvanica TaxID=56036 RepID=A0AAD2DH47_9LAMI|nr:unnamed protein product [Fraxinus pennsylvanica]